MGEDPEADGRMAVRTPMQWDAGANGGFSTARAGRLIQRVTPDGYGPEHVNVADQENDPGSLWSFLRALIGVRRRRPELGWGEFEVLESGEPSVLAHRVSVPGSAVVAVHNFAADPATVSLGGAVAGDDMVEDLLDGAAVVPHDGALTVALPGYGYRWFRVREG